MRVLMLSWEYPPKSVGGLSQHVYDLTRSLAGIGVDVHLVTMGNEGVPEFENAGGVKVYRVRPYQVSSTGFPDWVAQFNVAILERAVEVINNMGSIHLVHGHDWLVAFAARALKHAYKAPLVTTIHATEYGRNHGLHTDLQRHISDVEWWATYESWRVICCSRYMQGEVQHVFQVPGDKIRIIPNGVESSEFTPGSTCHNRESFAGPHEQIVLYVGRLVREKGVQVLLDAVPRILRHRPGTRFVVAGKGPFEENLKKQAEIMGVADKVYFTGYISNDLRNSLYSWASVAVIPSLYEPFGLVALEAMAAGTPVVISDTGGLAEIVNHGLDGLKFMTGDSGSLANMVITLLSKPVLAERIKQNAGIKIRHEYNWTEIAKQTGKLYVEVVSERRKTAWLDAEYREGGLFGKMSRFFAQTS